MNEKKYLRQWLLTTGLLFFLGLALAYDLIHERQIAAAVEYDRLLVQTRVIDENLSNQLTATYRFMLGILKDLGQWRAGNSYLPEANLMLKALAEANPGVQTLRIIDARGLVRASDRVELIGLNVEQREYFQTARSLHEPGALYLSPPYVTRRGAYSMTASLMIPGPAGKFNGIIAATFDPEYFRTLLASIRYAPDMWAAIAHGDGVQFLMVPYREGQPGKDLAQPGSFFSRHRDSGKAETLMTGRVYATEEERVMAIRTIRPAGAHLDKPLVAAVGRDTHAVFGAWRKTATIYAGGYFGVVLITLLSLLQYQKHVRRTDEQAKMAKEALEKSEKRYRLLIENLQEGIWLIDTDGNTTFANQSMAQMLGYSIEEMLGRNLLSFMDERGKTISMQLLKKRRQGVKEQHDFEFLHKNGSRVYATLATSPIPDEAGQYAGALAGVMNITERKRAEEALKRGEKELRDITSSLAEGLYMLNDSGEITFMNPEAERLLGWTEAELMGKNIHDMVHHHAPDGSALSFAECPIRKAVMTGGRYVSRDQVFIRKDGSAFPASISSSPVLENGRVAASITAFRDITERKQIEQDREQLIGELQKALAEIKTLHGILPICSNCKKIRDDKGAWHHMEAYLHDHTDAEFSHGLCEECAKTLYPNYFKEEPQKGAPK
ncbi:MAG TPA: PAS domain S-box protein [Nitrospirota bacterium]